MTADTVAILNDGAYGAEVHHFEPMGFDPSLVQLGIETWRRSGAPLAARPTLSARSAIWSEPLTLGAALTVRSSWIAK